MFDCCLTKLSMMHCSTVPHLGYTLLHCESLTFSSSPVCHFFAPPLAFPPPSVVLLHAYKLQPVFCSRLVL